MKTKLKRTNTKAFLTIIRAYIVDCIDDDYGTTPEEKMQWFINEFDRVANHPHNMQRIPNTQARCADWLAGLPTNIAFSNYDILEACKKMHDVDEIDDKTSQMLIDCWFSFIALHALRYAELLNLEPCK